MTKRVDEVRDLVRQISPILAGRSAQVQGAVLADLLATWIGGHGVVGNREATEIIRQELMNMHINAVLELVPHNESASFVFTKPTGHA